MRVCYLMLCAGMWLHFMFLAYNCAVLYVSNVRRLRNNVCKPRDEELLKTLKAQRAGYIGQVTKLKKTFQELNEALKMELKKFSGTN